MATNIPKWIYKSGEKKDYLKIYNSYLQIDLKGYSIQKNETIRIRAFLEIKSMTIFFEKELNYRTEEQ